MADPRLPYLIFGTTPFSGATVRIENARTTQELSGTTSTSGDYVFDCSNFISGVRDGDGIIVTLVTPRLITDLELYISIDNGLTWQYAEDQVTYPTTFNKTRGIVNTDQFPSGRLDNNISVSD